MKKIIYYTSFAGLLLSSAILADISTSDTFGQINNSFAVGFNLMHFNYREDAGDPAVGAPGNVEDYGHAYGLGLNIRSTFFERLYTDLYGEYAMGKLQYKGFNQLSKANPTYMPLSDKRSNDFVNVDMKLGAILLDTSYFQLIPYGGIGFRYWTPTTHNKYYNFKALLGAKTNLALSENLVLSPYANIGKLFYARAKAEVYDYYDGSLQGTANHKLGSKLIRELGVEINYRLDYELFLTAMVSHTHFEYEKSIVPVGSMISTEPNSKTNELRFSIGMRYGFL
jgi:hypothetical protein